MNLFQFIKRSSVNYTPDRQLHADVESKHKTADIWCNKSELKMECASYLCESSRSCTAPSTAVRLLFSSVRALVASCCITSDRLYNSIVSPGSTCRAWQEERIMSDYLRRRMMQCENKLAHIPVTSSVKIGYSLLVKGAQRKVLSTCCG